jgi:hypothetical protein
MAAITKAVLKLQSAVLEPLFTGALLWAISRGPPSIREPLLRQVEKLLGADNIGRFITGLKWAFALGLGGKINGALNSWALNNWKWRTEKHKWVWNREIAVVTGGCSGIGLEIVRGLSRKGVKVAVLDIQPLPQALENCRLFSTSKMMYCF